MSKLKDLKAALGNRLKPDLTHVRLAVQVYIARACGYGSDKYVRANYLRPPEDDTPRGHFLRYREYLGSDRRHTEKMLDALENHQALDPDLVDVEGMKRAIFCPDTDAGNDKVGPSMLPHIAHKMAGSMMALVQIVQAGMLPEDPGQTWEVLPSTTHTYDPAKVTIKFAGQEIKGFADGAEVLVAKAPPEDTRSKCSHGLLVGRHCIRCDGGIARREIRHG